MLVVSVCSLFKIGRSLEGLGWVLGKQYYRQPLLFHLCSYQKRHWAEVTSSHLEWGAPRLPFPHLDWPELQFPSARVHAQSLSRVGLFVTSRTEPTRLLCPWDSPGKKTGVGCYALFQGIFQLQGSNPCLLWLLHCRHILCCWATGKGLQVLNLGSKTEKVGSAKLSVSSLLFIWEEGLKVPTLGSRLGCLVTVGIRADGLFLFLPLQPLIAC